MTPPLSQQPPPVTGWVRQLRTPQSTPLCAVVGRPPGWFLAACDNRVDSQGYWSFFPKIDELPGDRLCLSCAAYALANHRHELTPYLIERLERESCVRP